MRNAVDHGLEDPETRVQKGKSRNGNIQIRAERDGGQIAIIVQDDGGGIDHQRILEKAVEKGLCQENEKATFTPQQCLNFLPAVSLLPQLLPT